MSKVLRDKRGQIKARATLLEIYLQKMKSDEASVDLDALVLQTSWADFEKIQSELELIDLTEIETNEKDEFANRVVCSEETKDVFAENLATVILSGLQII
ncbi:hypothetical protein FQA39_LY11424 [Lamprigera yunnana]|nr:hypothetical protein FQA39_LY11424 [Lamprigera yunnana]